MAHGKIDYKNSQHHIPILDYISLTFKLVYFKIVELWKLNIEWLGTQLVQRQVLTMIHKGFGRCEC